MDEIRLSDHQRQLIEGRSQGRARQGVNSEFVVPSAQVLDEGMASHADTGSPVPFQPTHWTESGFEASMVGFDPVVGVLGGVMGRERQESF